MAQAAGGQFARQEAEVCKHQIEKSLVESLASAQCFGSVRVLSGSRRTTEFDGFYLEQMPQGYNNMIFEVTRAIAYFFYPEAAFMLATWDSLVCL